MTDLADVFVCACHESPEEHEAAIEWHDRLVDADDEVPSCCERCGWELGEVHPVVINEHGETRLVGVALIGKRWVCHLCEKDEWNEYWFDEEQALNELQENEFSVQRDELEPF